MDTFADFEKTVDILALKQQPASTHKIDFQVLVDEDMKKNWDEAKRGKETTAALIAIYEFLLHDTKQVINSTMGYLVQLAGQYARLSLAGSYSAQVRSRVSFLEGLKGMGRLVDQEKVNETLGHMKRKLEVLNKVEEDAINQVKDVRYKNSLVLSPR